MVLAYHPIHVGMILLHRLIAHAAEIAMELIVEDYAFLIPLLVRHTNRPAFPFSEYISTRNRHSAIFLFFLCIIARLDFAGLDKNRAGSGNRRRLSNDGIETLSGNTDRGGPLAQAQSGEPGDKIVHGL